MKKEDKWIQDIRKSLEDYSEPLPSHLWEELEKELPAPKVIPMWRRWQTAAAAAVLVLAVSSLTVWFWSSPSAQYIQQIPVASQEVQPHTVNESSLPQVTVKEVTPSEAHEYLAQGQIKKTTDEVSPQTYATLPVEEKVPAPAIIKEESEKTEENNITKAEKENTEDTKQLRQQRMETDKRQMQRNQYLAYAQSKASNKQKWSVGVTAGNTPYSTSSSFGGFGRLDTRAMSLETLNPTNRVEAAYSQVLLNNREQVTQTDIRHRTPVTIGASVKWNLNDDWAIESGLNYTLLSSELHSGSQSYVEEEQKLHYIGIPLKIHRTIWQNKLFNFYASAGGMVEKCVSGEQEVTYAYDTNSIEKETRSLDISPLQWSVMAAVGAQVNIVKRFGIYIEPGMAYYFDDGSDVETIRKQHPFNFNLQFGLRFSLSK